MNLCYEDMWKYHTQCETARKQEKQMIDIVKQKGMTTKEIVDAKQEALTGVYSGQFWIYEEQKFARWPEYIKYYEEQDARAKLSSSATKSSE